MKKLLTIWLLAACSCLASAQQHVTITLDPNQTSGHTTGYLVVDPVTVTVTPTNATVHSGGLLQMNANILNSQNTGVTWRASAGSISSSGLFTAPVITTGQNVTITAVSVADPTKSNSVTVTLTTAIGISIAPTSATLQTGQTQVFTATLTGAANPTVNWSLTGAVGSITQGGLFTAGSAGTGSVVATSAQDSSVSISAPVTVTAVVPPTLVSIALSPSGSSQFDGSATSYTATGTYSDGSTAPVGTLGVWNTSNHTVATVGTPTPANPQAVNCLTPGSINVTLVVGSVTGTASLTCQTLIPSLTITTASLGPATVNQPFSQTINVTGGTPPYTFTTPAKAVPTGAIDVLTYLMPPPNARNTTHLTGAANKYFHIDGGLLWWLKGSNGNPWDGRLYDENYIYDWFTEDGDPADAAACGTAGYSSCFVDPFAYKMFVTPVPLTPRYWVPGTTVTIMSPPTLSSSFTLNPYVRTTNCGADNQSLKYLGNLKAVLSGPTTINFGGTVGSQPAVEIDYYYSGNVSGVYQNLEKFFGALNIGQLRWQHWTWNGTNYVLQQDSLNNNIVSGGSPVPNFACHVPTLPITNGLPAGVLLTKSPSLNLHDQTGVVDGTPTTAGSKNVTVQVQDATGAIAQKTFTFNVTALTPCTINTSTLPNGQVTQNYSQTMSTSNCTSPLVWSKPSGSFPGGIVQSGSTGSLTGTLTTAGTFNFQVSVTDANGLVATKNLSIVVTSLTGSCAIGTLSLPNATVGVAYNQAVLTNNCVAPLTWTNNAIPICTITTTSEPGGTVSLAYSAPAINTSNCVGPLTYSLNSGTLPSGISFANVATGSLSGTPTASGTSNFQLKVVDSTNAVATKNLSITIAGGVGGSWTAIGLPSGATQIRHFTIDSSNNFYVADRSSRFYKSTDQGATWNPINTGIAETQGWTIDWDPKHSQLIASTMVASGNVHFYKSTNGGTSWTAIPSPLTLDSVAAYSGPAVNTAGNIIFGGFHGLAGTCGTWYSTDGGSTTHAASCNKPPGGLWTTAFNPIDGNFYTGTEQYGLFRSTDGGLTFTEETPADSDIDPIANMRIGNLDGISWTASGQPVIGGQGGVWVGSGCPSACVWTKTYNNTNTSEIRTLFRDPSGNIYFGHKKDTSNLPSVYRSTDEGQHWSSFDSGLPTGLEAWQFIYNATDGHLYVYLQNGATNAGTIYKF